MKDLVVVSVLLLSVATGVASATTWYITPDGYGDAPTIQAGIDSASAGDTVLVAGGTYHEHDITLKSGILLTSETGEADCVTIEAGNLSRVFYGYGVSGTKVEGFTAKEGSVTNGVGGLMSCNACDLTFNNCVFTDGYSDWGGGAVYLRNCSAIFYNCEFSYSYFLDDEGMGMGGGVDALGGTPEFVDCVFLANDAVLGSAGAFGGDGCDATFEGCLFAGNRGYGAGICIWTDCTATIAGCTFEGNQSLGGGRLCLYRNDLVCITGSLHNNKHHRWSGHKLCRPGTCPQLLRSLWECLGRLASPHLRPVWCKRKHIGGSALL